MLKHNEQMDTIGSVQQNLGDFLLSFALEWSEG